MENMSKKWYDKKRFVLPLLFIIYPIGAIFLFVGKSFPVMKTKLIIAGGFGVLFLFMIVGSEMDKATQVNKEKEVKVENEVVIDSLQTPKPVRAENKKIFYGNNGTTTKGNYNVVYRLVNEESSLSNNGKTNITHHLLLTEINVDSIDREIVKDVIFDDFNLLKEKYEQEKLYFQVKIYTNYDNFLSKKAIFLATAKQLETGLAIEFYDENITSYQLENEIDTKINSFLSREVRIKEAFSSYNDSHKGLVKYVESRLNDPDSFEHAETTYIDKGDYLVVSMRYRATNGFGAKVLNEITAQVDLNGNVLSAK